MTEIVTRNAASVVRTYTYDANDRMLTEQTNEASPERVLRTYDDGGRLVRKLVKRGLEPASAIVSDAVYKWDAEDRLVRVEVAGLPAIDHKYDAMGNLIASVEAGTTPIDQRLRAFTLDSRYGFPQVVQEVGNNIEKYRYTVAAGMVPSGGWRMGQVRVSGTTETVSRFAVDAQGSIRSVFDSAGLTSDTLGYLPYGEVSDRTGSTLLPFGYTGEFFEPVSGLVYLRARWLEPGSGRFLSMDPFAGNLQQPISLNKYLYAHSNPVMGTDPGGKLASNEEASIAVAVASTLSQMATASLIGLGTFSVITGPGAAFSNAPYMSNPIQVQRAKTCATSRAQPGSCDAAMPIIFFGEDVLGHNDLIWDAMLDHGASPLLNWITGKHDRNWLTKKGGPCEGGAGPGMDCDEYPYAASAQGGEVNKSKGHARPVTRQHNQDAGRMLWNKLLKPCDLKPIPNPKTYHPWPKLDGISLFAVVPAEGLPQTIGRCANGKTQ